MHEFLKLEKGCINYQKEEEERVHANLVGDKKASTQNPNPQACYYNAHMCLVML